MMENGRGRSIKDPAKVVQRDMFGGKLCIVANYFVMLLCSIDDPAGSPCSSKGHVWWQSEHCG